jgi:plasmid replication initiation protein
VSQLRTNRDAKSEKDIDQAAILLAVVGEKYSGAIETAVLALPVSARKYLIRAMAPALQRLENYPRPREELSEAISQF